MSTLPAFAGSIPENYDRYLGPYIFEPYAVDTVARVPPGARKVLEIACGTGRVTAHLRKALPDAELIATDLNFDMLTIAQQRLGDKDITWQTADAQALPFHADQFDVVVCQFGLMFVPDQPAAMREVHRVLKPGGRLLLSTWDSLEANPSFLIVSELMTSYFPDEPPRFFQVPFSLHDDAQLSALARDAGFYEITVMRVAKTCVSASAADVAKGMLEGSPAFTQIMARDASLLPVMATALTEALAREYGKAPMQSPMRSLILEATRATAD